MKLRINISIFLVLVLLGGFSVGSEKLNLEDTVIVEQNINISSGSSRSSSKTVTETIYPAERTLQELILGTRGTGGYTAKYLAGVESSYPKSFFLKEAIADKKGIVSIRKEDKMILIEGLKEGKVTVTTKVYREDDERIEVITRIPIAVTDTVYRE